MIEIVAVNVIVAPTVAVAVHVHGNTTVAVIVRLSALDERGEQREDGSHNPFCSFIGPTPFGLDHANGSVPVHVHGHDLGGDHVNVNVNVNVNVLSARRRALRAPPLTRR